MKHILTYLQYAIDCYKPISGQIMVTSTVVKNTFGVSFSLHKTTSVLT